MSKKVEKVRAAMREFASSFPEAWEDFPWEHGAMKVRKKVFAFLGMAPIVLPLSHAEIAA